MRNVSTKILADLKHHGVFRTIEDVALRVANHLILLKILKCIKIEAVNPEFLTCDERYRGLFLSEEMLRGFSSLPEYQLSEEFLDRALAKGDACYGFLDGDVLAAYGWYSNKPTETDLPGVVVNFTRQHIYMYKGFTHENYRGKRLHAIGMTRALEAYLARGYAGIVSYVDWNNFASLKSCYRMGYKDFGNIYAARVLKNYILHSDAGCRSYGFGLELVTSNRAGASHGHYTA